MSHAQLHHPQVSDKNQDKNKDYIPIYLAVIVAIAFALRVFFWNNLQGFFRDEASNC
jgi:hypothetical protein